MTAEPEISVPSRAKGPMALTSGTTARYMLCWRMTAMMGWDGGWGWGGWLALSLGMLAFWGLLAFGVVALVRTLRREDRDRPAEPVAPVALPAPRGSSAQEVLDGRFARGEIDADEYRQRRGLLSKH